MDILIIMCIGILLGRLTCFRKIKKYNEYLSLCCTFILIFTMGVMLGQKQNLFNELTLLGYQSFIFFFIPALFSIIIVYLLTQQFMKNKIKPQRGEKL